MKIFNFIFIYWKLTYLKKELNTTKHPDDIKKALVIIKSRPEVPFVSDTDEVILFHKEF